MASSSIQYNPKSPAVKRLMKEALELRHPTEEYFAQPLDENLFDWHFTLRGPKDTCFSDGIYHGRLLLPTEYPLKPPDLFLFTPNGRFQTNKKICLSISGHHPESWMPSWSIRTILLALIGFMPSKGLGTIGSLDYTNEERIELAKKSLDWKCNVCGQVKELLKDREAGGNAVEAQKDDQKLTELEEKDKEMLKMINFKGDIEQQQESTSVNKATTKSSGPDQNEISNRDTREQVQQERINELNTSAPGSSGGQQATNSSRTASRTDGLLSRISPVIICILIAIIVLKRLYSFFTHLE